MAEATPMPTSQRPSRTRPGCGLRLFHPKRLAPSRKHSTSWRCENGGCGLCFSGAAFDCGSDDAGLAGLSGTTCVSLAIRNSIGSMPSFSAISSIAISSAASPGASFGARIAFASGRSSIARRFDVMRCGPA